MFVTKARLSGPIDGCATAPSALLLLLLCVASFTQCAMAEPSPFLLDSAPRLGDSIKQFKRIFPAAHCRRRSSGEVDERELKREWNRWIDCAVEKEVFAYGKSVSVSNDAHTVVAVNATFRDQRLVSLEYVYGLECLDELLRSFVSQYGPPDSLVRNHPDETLYVSWTRCNSRLEIEQLTIRGYVDGSGAFRIEKNSAPTGIRVRISVRGADLLAELQEQENLGESASSH